MTDNDGSNRPDGSRREDWTEAENRAIVDDYLAMLALESTGKPYSKTVHRKALIESMGGTRSPGSIERKHQNISAVMLQLGLPYIKGYKPLPNIQQALLIEVRRRLEENPKSLAGLQTQPPSPAEARFSEALRQVAVPEMPPEPHGRKVDYGLLQEESKRVGDRGEEFVVNHEKAALEKAGRADLAADVLWVAREIGDGAGYDIRSYRPDGRPRYIEVKATKLGALTPFYITSAELDFARRHQGEYAIYRVFDIDGDAPEFYVLEGDLNTLLATEPVTYRARPV
jgi:Protein NO VEIN, C-terminal